MLKTYTGSSADGVELVVRGVSYGIVKPGESVAVPDDVAESVEWPEENWSDGQSPKEPGPAAAPVYETEDNE